MVILTVTSILMLKIPAIRNDSDRPARLVTREFDDDAGSAIIRWAEAVSEQAGNSDTVSVSAPTVIQQTAIERSDPHLTEELLAAVRRGSVPVVKLLLECVSVDAQDPRYGRTALSIAAEIGDISMATLLLDQGASVHTRQFSRSCWDDGWGPDWIAGRTPLGWAAVKGQSHIVELLLKWGANPNSANSGGRSALLDACYEDDQKSVRLLLEHGADVDSRCFHHVCCISIHAFEPT
jgi:ankyrin repeat protein